jgi:hypothetical protein
MNSLRKNIGYYVVLILGLVAGLYYLVNTEKRVTSDINWYSGITLDSKDPLGMYVMYQLIKKKYSEKNVWKGTIYDFMELGNMEEYSVVVLSQKNPIRRSAARLPQSIGTDLNFASNVLFLGNFSESSDYKLRTVEYLALNDCEFYVPALDTSFVFSLKNITVDSSQRIYYPLMELQDELFKPDVLISTDSSGVFYKYYYEPNREDTSASNDWTIWNTDEYSPDIYFHTIPSLFSNIAAKQDWYVSHFNYVFDHLDTEFIFLVNSDNNRKISESPIGLLLENRSLKAAYYLSLLSLLLYIFFEGKRRQRAVPILSKTENTSLEYVETIARLFEIQKKNAFVVDRMSEQFYHQVQKKYHIHQDHPQFKEILSKKAEIPMDLIEKIQILLSNITRDQLCSDEQLLNVNRYFNQIQDKLNYGRE